MVTKTKRFLCMLMAVLMVLSTPISVFAENSTSSLIQGVTGVADVGVENTTTGKIYDDVSEALKEAKADETVTLLFDTETSILAVPEAVTLDLNGFRLKADYVACYGNIVDQSEDNAGVLIVDENRFQIQGNSAQIPAKTEEGYQFFEVLKFNSAYLEDSSTYAFQPFVEKAAHELLKQGAAASDVTINVRISWTTSTGKRSQDFVFSDAQVAQYLNSYVPAADKYTSMLTLTLKGAEGFDNLTFSAVVVSGKGITKSSEAVEMNKKDESENLPETENNQLTKTMTLENGQASAVVAEGTEIAKDAKELTLTTEKMDETTSNIQLNDGEQMLSMDVHVEGVAKNNTVPVIITIDEIAPEYLNQGNITLYHVENGKTVEMTRVYSLEEVDAHNEFYYDILTGTITMALATFSEVAVVAETEKAWEGKFDYTWYDASKTELTIANADQLAAFGAIVGGMNGQTKDSFDGKTVKLLSDINLGDVEKNNNADIIFYPIGYYNSTGSYEKVSGGSVTSNVSSFKGTFDGNGHTVSNFYQNTWEMFGDYNDGYSGTPNHYKDAMGLFGYVNGGTVKNLSVSNFSSDGEFTPTGVIAAYASNAAFENIAIVDCNPRVYNTGNGGIVGIGGNNDDPDTYKLRFTNITIDNTNKISALWGSWDVACGGLVGMFRGAGHAYMTNCHVAAQIDVFNDVCGNYQYYWYRYAGMMIGTNKTMVTDKDGYTVPETSKFHAENCTVHFGDWNNYYYCELVANSLASYTHDHQFSRLTQVDSVDVENKTVTVAGKTTAVSTSGRANYVVVKGTPATENATCYHFVDGEVWNHEDAGKEVVNGNEVFKEDNQHIYLPFNQLFTGYGWGVKHIPVYNGPDYAFEGITILDRTEANSLVKFGKAATAKETYKTESEVAIGELFEAVTISDPKLSIKSANVQVTVSAVGDESTATGTYVANTEDWKQGTLTFAGVGTATITITDYYFCTPTTITVMIEDYVPVTKFETKVDDGTSYVTESKVTIGDLFKAAAVEYEKLTIESKNVQVTVSAENTAEAIYVANTEDWTQGTLTFTGVGAVKVTITDGYYCIPTTLTVLIKDYDPVIKFKQKTVEEISFEEETPVFVGNIFEAIENLKFEIESDKVQVTVSPTDENNTVSATYTANVEDWTQSTLLFKGSGKVVVTITDNYYCIPTTVEVNITEKAYVEKFKSKFTGNFLYRVGNAAGSTVALDSLFEGISNDIDDVSVTVDALDGTAASGTYTSNATWQNGKIQFAGTGIVKVTIKDSDKYCIPTELVLEVVDAVNATSAASARSNNVVLLKNVGFSTLDVSNGYYLYGNGFTMTCTSDKKYDSMKSSYVTLDGGTLDNVQIVVPNYSYSILFNKNKNEDGNKHTIEGDNYGNISSAVSMNGNSNILNSRISGGRAAVYVTSGYNLIENSTIVGGAAANIHVVNPNKLTLRDVTLIQEPTQANVNDTTKTVMGFSVLVECDSNGSAPIALEGTLRQYAWACKDYSQYVPLSGREMVDQILKDGKEYIHNITYSDGKTAESLNLGFAYIWPEGGVPGNAPNTLTDIRSDKANIPYNYVLVNGMAWIYSYKNEKSLDENMAKKPEYISEKYSSVLPKVSFNESDKEFITEYNPEKGWMSTLTIDLPADGYTFSFDKLSAQKYGKNLNYTVKKLDGSVVDRSKEIKITDTSSEEYILSIEETKVYDKEGNIIENACVYHEYPFVLTATKKSIDPPEKVAEPGGTPLLVVKSKGGDWSCAIPALEETQIKYYKKSKGDYETLSLSDLVPTSTGKQNGTNNYWLYTAPNGDYTLKVTCGYIHDTKQIYGMPVVVNNNGNKMYFTISSTNGYVSTNTAARSVTLTYEFTDANNKTLTFSKNWNFKYADYKNGKQYSYEKFVTGKLEEASGTCVTPETLITLSDGTMKAIKDITGNEQILVWNHEKAAFDSAPIAYIVNHDEVATKQEVITLKYEDGSELEIIGEHVFFDTTLNKYISLDENASDYIGHKFLKMSETNNTLEKVELVKVEKEVRNTKAYELVTYKNITCFTNGILSASAYLDKILNVFEVNAETYGYDLDQIQKDIETYGLYTYEDFKDVIDEKAFEMYNAAYLKVAVGKGYITWNDILELIDIYYDVDVQPI